MREPTEARVLIIDANAHIRRLIRTLMDAIGITDVTEARDPRTADEAMTLKPDLVIADWTGEATEIVLFVDRIRRGELGARDVPVLAMTSTTHHAVLEQAVEVGFDDVVAKPLSAFDVIQRSVALLAEARRADWPAGAKAAE